MNFVHIHQAVSEGCFRSVTGYSLSLEHRKRIREEPALQPLLQQLWNEAENAVQQGWPSLPHSLFRLYADTGDRLHYEKPYFERRLALLSLTLRVYIDADQPSAAIASLEDLIWDVLGEYSWALPAHIFGRTSEEESLFVDLFAAETAYALAETDFWLQDRLSPAIRKRIRVEVERRVFTPFFERAKPFWWESKPTNWPAVCAGAAGMAALLLVEDHERLAGMIDRSIRNMEVFLSGYGQDGICLEGMKYWIFGFGYFVYFSEMLREYTQDRIDLLANDQVRRIANYPLVVHMDGDRFYNYADSPAETDIPAGLASRLQQRLDVKLPVRSEVSPKVTRIRWGHLARNLLWYDPLSHNEEAPIGSFLHPDSGLFTDRRLAWNGRTMFFGVKGGHNGEPHNHNDLGHFVIHVGSDTFLADLGLGTYSKQYFANSGQSVNRRSYGHSVPVVNGFEQRTGAESKASVIESIALEKGIQVSLDITSTYPDAGLIGYSRTWSWQTNEKEAWLTMRDEFTFIRSENRVEEAFISLVEPVVSVSGVIWQSKSGYVEMSFAASGASVRVEPLPYSNRQGQSLIAYRVAVLVDTTSDRLALDFVYRCVPSCLDTMSTNADAVERTL